MQDEQRSSGEFIALNVYSNYVLSDEIDEDPVDVSPSTDRELQIAKLVCRLCSMTDHVADSEFQELMSTGMRFLSSNPARFCSEFDVDLATAIRWFNGTHAPALDSVRFRLLKQLQRLLARELEWWA